MQQLNIGTLTEKANSLSPLLLGAAVITFAFLVVFFLFTGNAQDFKKKIMGFIALIFGFAAFIGFFGGGLYIGKMIGIGDLGAFIGIFVFWAFFSVIAYYRTPKEKRRRKTF